MKKIAYVLASYPVLSETFVGTEMRNMQLCGHDVQPIAFHRHQGDYQTQDQTLKEHTLFLSEHSKMCAFKGLAYLDLGLIKALLFSFRQQGLPFKSLIANALKLAYIARKNNCTHFHAHFAQGAAATAIVAARLCGATVSFVGHGYDIYATPQDLKLKLNAADFAIAVCQDMVNYFKELAPNVAVSLVYCGVELDRFSNAHSQSTTTAQNAITTDNIRNMQRKNKKLLFIGRLCETKGLFTLLHALKLIDKCERPIIDLVGDGVLKNDLVKFVDQHQLSKYVNFLGAQQSTWFIANSHHYDALIVPFELASNGDRDTGPVVVKEAMALKLPVITTYFMGCKEFITHNSGFRVPPNNPTQLAQAIGQFYSMSSREVQSLKDNAYHRVDELYSAKKQAAHLSSVIEQHKTLTDIIRINIRRYSHFALIAIRPKSRELNVPLSDTFKCSAKRIKTLPLCPINGKDALIAFFDQENGICMNDADNNSDNNTAEHMPRERNQVSVVKHNDDICLMKTYQKMSCLINEACSLDKLKHIKGVPKLIDISLKYQQAYQSLVPGTSLSEILNDNGITPLDLYLYENEMSEHAQYPCDFNPLNAAAFLSPTLINKLSIMINAIHDAGVLIRDVKFGNILVQDDTPYLVDFDAATILSSDSKANRLLIAKENYHFNRLLPLNLSSI